MQIDSCPAAPKVEYSSFVCGAGPLELQVSRVCIGTARSVRRGSSEQARFGLLFVEGEGPSRF